MRRAWEALALVVCLVVVVNVASSLLQDVTPGLLTLGALLLIGSLLFKGHSRKRRW